MDMTMTNGAIMVVLVARLPRRINGYYYIVAQDKEVVFEGVVSSTPMLALF